MLIALASFVTIFKKLDKLWGPESCTELFDQDAAHPETLVVFHDLPWRVMATRGMFWVVAADGQIITTCRTRSAAKQVIRQAHVLSGELKLFARLAHQPGDNNVR